MRRCSGIWPPSNPRLNLNPDRDLAPLCPRPAVFPDPEPWPRPMRFFACFMPRGGLRLLRGMALLGDLHQVSHLVNHPARGGRGLQLDRMTDPPEAEAAHDRRLIVLEADRALEQRHLDGGAFRVRALISHWLPPVPPILFLEAGRSSLGLSATRDRRTSRGRRCAG